MHPNNTSFPVRFARVAFGLLLCACGADLATTTAKAPISIPPGEEPPATVEFENLRSGTDGWVFGSDVRADQSDLAVYAAPYAVHAGDSLAVFIHSASGAVNVQLSRLGWYGGIGAREVFSSNGVAAGQQPSCGAATGVTIECPWQQSMKITTSRTWASGVYLLRVTNAAGKVAFYPFVLETDTPADFVVVVPQFTWQAYNNFGGTGLYGFNSAAGPSPSVSFERPYKSNSGANGLFNTTGSNDIGPIRFLERSGYNVTYVSDIDLVTRAPAVGALARRGLIFLGHDEYWTWDEYSGVEALRDNGKHMAFLSANTSYWNIRTATGRFTGQPIGRITCLRAAVDPGASGPHDVTTTFRTIGRPENALTGIMFMNTAVAGTTKFVASAPAAGSVGAELLATAGIKAGDAIPDLSAGEGDIVVDNGLTPAGLQILLTASYGRGLPEPSRGPAIYHTTFFVTPRGAGVFSSGTDGWPAALDERFGTNSHQVQALTHAVLDWMLAH